MKKVLVFGLTLCLTCLLLHPQTDSRDAVLELEKLTHVYINSGKSIPSKQAVLDFFKKNDTPFEKDYAYLKAKLKILSYWDDHAGYHETLSKIPAEHLNDSWLIYNALQDRWDKDMQEATLLIEKMAAFNDDTLEKWVHESFTQAFINQGPKADTQKKQALQLLVPVAKSKSAKIQRIFSGVQLWLDGMNNKGNPEYLIQRSTQKLDTKETHWPRYQMLLYHLMNAHPAIQAKALLYLDTIINRLQEEYKPFTEERAPSRSDDFSEKKARYKYWLALANYLKAQYFLKGKDNTRAEEYLKQSAQFSPDHVDAQFSYAYFYEKIFFDDKESFVSEYSHFLKSRGKKKEALAVLETRAIYDHLMKKELVSIYNQMDDPATFKTYWSKKMDQLLPVSPDFSLVTLANKTIKLSQLKGQWVLIDFWGTWCSSCVDDLPNVEAFYRNSIDPKAKNPKIALLTISCRDKLEAAKTFMATNKYTFPVSIDTGELVKAYQVIQYPTKVLITPTGHYVKISTHDWQEFVEEYIH